MPSVRRRRERQDPAVPASAPVRDARLSLPCVRAGDLVSAPVFTALPAESYSEHELRDFRENQSKAWNPMYNGHRWLATVEARDAQIEELRDTLRLYVIFHGADDDGGEHRECALCEAKWPAEELAKHDDGCVLYEPVFTELPVEGDR